MSEYAGRFIDIRASNTLISADEHAQTSESPNMATAAPSARRGPDAAEAARRVARAGRAAIPRQHPSSPESAARNVCPGAASSHSGHLRGIGPRPDQEPGRILIPSDGATGDQGAQNRPACPVAATRRLRPVPSQRLPDAMVPGVRAVL